MRWFKARSRKVQILLVGILLLALCGCISIAASPKKTSPTLTLAGITQTPASTQAQGPTNTPRPTATQTPVPPTATPKPTATPLPAVRIEISRIAPDGKTEQETDEWAEIANTGSQPVHLKGYRLNAGTAGQDFTFPDYALEPGKTCRVYTNEVHPETCGFSFGSREPLWRNDGDCGTLFDASGAQVDERCYKQ